MVTIRLTNSMTHRKEEFVPLDAGNVRMYVCGPTVYDRAHLGNARPVVVFDVLYRLLRQVYGAEHVTYVRNFTDVDDKINAKAAETGRDIRAITDETIGWYHADMDALGALRPDHEPRATEYIGAMVAMIEGLVARDHAYAAKGHVLFRVRSYADYGALSGRSVDDMIAGARVEVAPFKEDPMDFVLWKPSEEGVPGWESPWGFGRPGWHIECSAMADKLLWEDVKDSLSPEAQAHPHAFDIHGGGLDLQFPHHENEIAQSCCANEGKAEDDGTASGFARYWLHNEMLLVEGKKMSKSLGNFFTVRDLLDQGVPGEVIRFVLLSTHYRKPMDWTEEKAREAEKTLGSWWFVTRNLEPSPETDRKVSEGVMSALKNDLNTHQAIAQLSKLKNDPQALLDSARFLGFLSDEVRNAYRERYLVFGIGSDDELRSIAFLIAAARAKAKQVGDFSEVDRLKAIVVAAGLEVRMYKDEVELVPGPDFDPAKLEALK